MKKESLNEELNRMKKLMNFDISENSHDVLSEQLIVEQNETWTDDYIEAWIYERLLPNAGKKVWNKGTEESKANAIANIRNKFQTYGERKTAKKIHPKRVYLKNVDEIDIDKPSTILNLSFTLTDEGFEPFPNNNSQPGPDLLNAIQEKVTQFSEDCPNDPPNSMGVITKVEIYTSSSRLRNTGTYENQTWLKLSEDRARNAYSAIAQMFGEAGYPVPGSEDGTPDALVVNWEGQNGDGSSGKEDPYKGGKIKTGGESQGTDSLKEEYYSAEMCDRANKPSPPCGEKREELDQYKYIKVLIQGECITVDPDADVEYTFDLGTYREHEKDKGKKKKKRSWCWSNGGLKYCFKWLKGKEGWSTKCDKKTQRKIKRKSRRNKTISYHNTNMKGSK